MRLFKKSATGLFASESLLGHALRGVMGFGLVLWALAHPATPILAMLAGIGGLIAFRGCPMCWTIGLFESISQKIRLRTPR